MNIFVVLIIIANVFLLLANYVERRTTKYSLGWGFFWLGLVSGVVGILGFFLTW